MVFRIVLCYPQIPPNTGCIARTCAGTNTPLHLIEPINFKLDEKSIKRAGLDYWPAVDLTIHKSFDEFLEKKGPGRLIAFSPWGTICYHQFRFFPNDFLVHGPELEGLPQAILEVSDHIVYIPMFSEHVRSLNLAVSASLSLYEAIRQHS